MPGEQRQVVGLMVPSSQPRAAPYPAPLPYLLTPGPQADGQEQGSQHLQKQQQRVKHWSVSILPHPQESPSLSSSRGLGKGEG